MNIKLLEKAVKYDLGEMETAVQDFMMKPKPLHAENAILLGRRVWGLVVFDAQQFDEFCPRTTKKMHAQFQQMRRIIEPIALYSERPDDWHSVMHSLNQIVCEKK